MEGIDVSKRGKASRCNGGPLSPVVKQGNVGSSRSCRFLRKNLCTQDTTNIDSFLHKNGMESRRGRYSIRFRKELRDRKKWGRRRGDRLPDFIGDLKRARIETMRRMVFVISFRSSSSSVL